MGEPCSSQVNWQRVNWQALLSKLTACALRWFRMEGCYEADSVLPGTGTSAVDLVYDAVFRILSDKNSTNLVAENGDPFPYMLTVLRHDFLDLVKHGREYSRTVTTDGKKDHHEQFVAKPDSRKQEPFYQVDTMVLVKKLHLILGDDVELQDYVSAWLLNGLDKRADIAYYLGVSEQEITNRKRRLIYKLKPYARILVKSRTGGEHHG